jgi:CheY-like chemotaxis protein
VGKYLQSAETLTLDVTDPMAAERAMATAGAVLAGGVSVRCLIVDDNAPYVAVARRVLERDGVTVVGVASTTADALEQADATRPDVTLVDVKLGDEDGFELARRLADRGDGRAHRVILMSAYSQVDLREFIAASPAIGFLPKTALTVRAVAHLVAAG